MNSESIVGLVIGVLMIVGMGIGGIWTLCWLAWTASAVIRSINDRLGRLEPIPAKVEDHEHRLAKIETEHAVYHIGRVHPAEIAEA